MTEKKEMPSNVIFIGKKPLSAYLNSAQYQLKRNNEIKICARGKNISKAVDLAEILEKRFLKGEVEKGEIKTNSESFELKENGRKISVSTIEIILKRIKKKKLGET